MNILKKIGFIVVLLLIVPLLFFIVIENQQVVDLPFRFAPIKMYPGVGPYMADYLFWGSTVLLILFLILILVVLFWPMNRTTIIYHKGSSSLKVNKKAVDNFILAAIQQEDYIAEPRVKSKLKKNKVMVFIEGNVKATTDVSGKIQLFTNKLETELREFLGIEEDKQVIVSLKNLATSDSKKTKRVY